MTALLGIFGSGDGIDRAQSARLIVLNGMLITMEHVFKALANAHRRKMLVMLGSADHTLTELAFITGLSKPGAWQYLSQLEAAGLVSSKHKGRSVAYSLHAENLEN